eukprot:PITA_07773
MAMLQNQAIGRVQTLAESGIQTVPPEFVRQVDKALVQEDLHVPIIDLHGLSLLPQHHHDQNHTIAAQIADAAEKWGFFLIINHGVPDSLIARVQAAGKAFFQLPIEEKEAYANEPKNPIGYGSKVGYSDGEDKWDWGDYYYNTLWPPATREMTKWPIQVSDFTEAMDEYRSELSKLFEWVMAALSRDLDLETENSLNESVGEERKELHIRINYYPPCPQPDLVVGLAPHSDIVALTILLDDQIPGLQIRKDGEWLDVQCIPGALVVNVGDQLEILSNGKYKSIEHRSVVHKDRSRMSWAMFCSPAPDVVVSPRTELTDEEHPPLYQGVSFGEYRMKFFKKGFEGKDHIHGLKVQSDCHSKQASI